MRPVILIIVHVKYKAGRILQSPVIVDSRQPDTSVVESGCELPHQRMAPTDRG